MFFYKSSSLLIFQVVALLVVSSSCIDLDCNLVPVTHSEIEGIGVLAGKNYKRGEIVERCIAVTIPNSKMNPLLDEYAFGHDEGYADLLLGYAMIYNHQNNNSVTVTSYTHSSPRRPPNVTRVYDFYLTANHDIMKGQEIFTSYGNEHWFLARNIPFVRRDKDVVESLDKITNPNILPGCPHLTTDIVSGMVYAAQYIKAGEIVEVTRGLVLPGDTGEGNDLERFLWYHHRFEDKALLVLGHGAMYLAVAEQSANLKYDWYFHDSINVDIEGNAMSQHQDANQPCQSTMLVMFTATRYIEPGERLQIPLHREMGSHRRFVVDSSFSHNCFGKW